MRKKNKTSARTQFAVRGIFQRAQTSTAAVACLQLNFSSLLLFFLLLFTVIPPRSVLLQAAALWRPRSTVHNPVCRGSPRVTKLPACHAKCPPEARAALVPPGAVAEDQTPRPRAEPSKGKLKRTRERKSKTTGVTWAWVQRTLHHGARR